MLTTVVHLQPANSCLRAAIERVLANAKDSSLEREDDRLAAINGQILNWSGENVDMYERDCYHMLLLV